MPPLNPANSPKPQYWRSLDQLADAPAFRRFLEAEFPDAGVPFLATEGAGGLHRRRWLQVMGASLALATAAGCRWEKAEILPFTRRPAERVPGAAQHYATTMEINDNALGLIVTCVDGRPLKIEGNPRHPSTLGGTNAWSQAAVLEMYDPDRSQHVIERTPREELVREWKEFDAFAAKHFSSLRSSGGRGLRILSEASASPTLLALRARWLEVFPQCRWCTQTPVPRVNEVEGARLAWGRPLRTHYALDRARVILDVDADLLGLHPAAIRHTRQFADGRAVHDGQMNRLYSVEPIFSLTGAAADHRLAKRSSDVPIFLLALQQAIEGGPINADEETTRLVRAVAEDLKSNRGRGVIALGSAHDAYWHALVHHLNAKLGNVGETVYFTRDGEADAAADRSIDLPALVEELKAGEVETLVLLGGNPAYDAPSDLAFASALAQAKSSIHLSLYRNETSRLCTWHLPRAHWLEAWGDSRAWDGAYGVAQPMIEPLYAGRTPIEALTTWLDVDRMSGLDLVRAQFAAMTGRNDLDSRWQRLVHDGVATDSVWPREEVDSAAPQALPERPPLKPEAGFQIVLRPDLKVFDGRYANNGWLQELPDPMSRLTWDNAALISPQTAEEHGIADGTLIELRKAGQTLRIPAYVMPGMAADTIAAALGYGRTAAGKVAGSEVDLVAPVGVDLYALRTANSPSLVRNVEVVPTGIAYELAGVQDHFAIDAIGKTGQRERLPELVREGTLDEYREHPDFAQHMIEHPPLESLWHEREYNGYRWGMVIDMSRCTGCGACVVACQAENNIPVVGKDRVLAGREMQWLRIDRYFRGEPHGSSLDLRVVMQPMACQQCQMAPCEAVCPVNATVHSQEGLNDMVYNRCVGTRYCANNCPYKVRRFNFFNYHTQFSSPENEVLKMANNPEVTVRSRGVMEKCTYCVQRIQAAKIVAKNERRGVRDGEIKTACQQACPAGAIVFGDLNDPESQVAKLAKSPLGYAVLAEYNTQPRTEFLARLRNANLDLPSAADAETEEHPATHRSDAHGTSKET